MIYLCTYFQTESRSGRGGAGRGEARHSASLSKPRQRLSKPHSYAQSPIPFLELELMPSVALGFSPFGSFDRRNPTQRLPAAED